MNRKPITYKKVVRGDYRVRIRTMNAEGTILTKEHCFPNAHDAKKFYLQKKTEISRRTNPWLVEQSSGA